MKNSTVKRIILIQIAVLSIVCAPVPAAILLQIDESRSSFSKESMFCFSGCNAAEQFQISGLFEVAFDTFSPSIDLIYFNALSIETTLREGEEFNFPEYPVRIEYSSFSGNGNPCNYIRLSGTCLSMGNFGGISGSFDGALLTISGSAPIDFDYSHHYSITAMVIPSITAVPTLGVPGLILLMVVLILISTNNHNSSMSKVALFFRGITYGKAAGSLFLRKMLILACST